MEDMLSIKVISGSCGIKPHTLRVWEQRYSAFKPGRDANGQRVYSNKDLKRAQLFSVLIDKGHSISKLAALDNIELEALVNLGSDSNKEVNLNEALSTKHLMQYISNYDISKAAAELQHLRLSIGTQEFIFKIVLPTLREIGSDVAKGRLTVTQEHIISTIIREQLGQVYLPNFEDGVNKQIALATPDGNLHELSIIIADILCRSHRVTTRYLGAAHPANCLAEALNALKCKTLILGSVSSDQWDYDKKIGDYLSTVDKDLDHGLQVILGGGREIKLPKFKNINEVLFMNSFEGLNSYLSI